jgi:hypothetical protein
VDGRKKKGGSTKGSGHFGWLGQVTHRRTKNRGLIGAQKAYTSPICPQPVLLCVGFFFLNPAEDPCLVSACWVWHHVMIYCHLITVH